MWSHKQWMGMFILTSENDTQLTSTDYITNRITNSNWQINILSTFVLWKCLTYNVHHLHLFFAHWNVCSRPREKLPKPVGHTDPGRAVACASQGPNGSHNGSMADPWQIHDPMVNTTAAPAARPAWLESRKRCSCSTPSTHTDVNWHNKQTNRLNRFRKNRPQIAFSTELEEFEKFDFNILQQRIRHKLTHHGNRRSVQGVVLATAVRCFSGSHVERRRNET